uniref:Uncharacterized protein n=1 Tax=Romanomermis culicivorax TaxID=13658 RepID=A0A915KRD6_ROMCU
MLPNNESGMQVLFCIFIVDPYVTLVHPTKPRYKSITVYFYSYCQQTYFFRGFLTIRYIFSWVFAHFVYVVKEVVVLSKRKNVRGMGHTANNDAAWNVSTHLSMIRE